MNAKTTYEDQNRMEDGVYKTAINLTDALEYINLQRKELVRMCTCWLCKLYFINKKIWIYKIEKKLICDACYQIIEKKQEFIYHHNYFQIIEGLAKMSQLPPLYIKKLQEETNVFQDYTESDKKKILWVSKYIHSEILFDTPIMEKIQYLHDISDKTPQQKNELKNFRFYQKQYNKIMEEDFTCPICYDIYENNIYELKCTHKICEKCAKQYKKMKRIDFMICPYCKNITEEKKMTLNKLQTQKIYMAIIKNGIFAIETINKWNNMQNEKKKGKESNTTTKKEIEDIILKMKYVSSFKNPN